MRRLREDLSCPICKSRPDIGLCEPWPQDAGPQPFYACCYRMIPFEHCIAVNGGSHRDVLERWDEESRRYALAQSEEKK